MTSGAVGEGAANGERRRVALYGGSFNPPHVAHQMVGLYVLETVAVDELWIVPAFIHAFGKPLAPFEDRLQMCALAVAALGARARVSDVERELGGPSRTLHTLHRLRERHPDHEFSLVIGADLVDEVPSWLGGDELRRTVPFIVVGRGARRVAADDERVAMPEVSSTAVRERLGAGKGVDGLVPRAVLDYIYGRGLYRAAPTHQELP
jgi:nicotinate-nucleotide adenylyltransferase